MIWNISEHNVGTEELAHLEMVAAIVHQLTRNLSMEEIEKSGFAPYYTDHTIGIWPQAAGGIPFNACEFQSKGDVITDLFEDMAAEPYPCKHKQFLLIFKSANVSQLELYRCGNAPPACLLLCNLSAYLQSHSSVPLFLQTAL